MQTFAVPEAHFTNLELPQDPVAPPGVPDILVGPLLRHRDAEGNATIFLEVDRPCPVVVRVPGRDPLRAESQTWTVHDHHYALVILGGLPADEAVPYEIVLGGVRVWPIDGSAFPPSRIPPPPGDGLRLVFGSCRELGPYDDAGLARWGADALVALAHRLALDPGASWPDLILHLGDQVYADEPSPEIAERLRVLHADDPEEIREEIHNFEEYTWLYQTTWMHGAVRWLLSTVPNAMILDDHDLRDDWNTSKSWRAEMERRPWWRDRVVGALASYWVYQHIGNLSPRELVEDETYQAVTRATDPAEATALLDAFAWRADTAPDATRWSFARDLGPARLVVIDSRCSRVLDPPQAREIVDAAEWDWLTAQVARGPMPRHLIVASTLPVFLPYGIHHVEGWSEAIATGAWGRRWSRIGERLRQAIDFEHWAAFRRSFDRLVNLLGTVTRRSDAPSSILILSGDVHFSYTASVELLDAAHPATAIHQLVQSPMRNQLPRGSVTLFRFLQTRLAAHLFRPMARLARVRDPAVRWRFDGPLAFDNGVMTVALDGEHASVAVERARVSATGREHLVRTELTPLTAPNHGSGEGSRASDDLR